MTGSVKAWLLQRLRSRRAQTAWESVHGLALIGMNFWASELSSTGETDVIRDLVRKLAGTGQPVIFDVGANVGDFSALCLTAFRGRCTVHAFEPSPSTFQLLRNKLRLSEGPNLELHNVGFSDADSERILYSSELGSTIASVHQLERPIRPLKDEFSERVNLTTIDGFCERNGIEWIDYLKLDIEGHEYQALSGAARMLRERRIRFVQFEFGENNVASRTYLADFHRLLGDTYRMFRIVPGGLVPWRYQGGRTEIFATMNYLCEITEGDQRLSG